MTTLPAQPQGFAESLLEHIRCYESTGWQLDVLRTYVRDGEVRQHPPKGWPTKQGSIANEITDGAGRLAHGVALVLGPSGVVDIDLDSDAARELAPRFLRPTAAFGRKGRVTHFLYRCAALPHPDNGGPEDQPKTRRVPNPWGGDKATLVELRRGPGAQTTPPPTVKPDGHPAVWMTSLDQLATWDWSGADEERFEDLALAALVASEPHVLGGRHDSALRWAGELACRHVPQERAERVLLAGFEHRGDRDLEDRRRCVGDTYSRHAEGETVSRLEDAAVRKAVDEILGRGPIDAVAVDIGGDLAGAIDRINAALADVPADEATLFRVGGSYGTIDGTATAERLAVELARKIRFTRTNAKGEPTVVHPSNDLIRRWASVPDERIPELLGRWPGPLLRPDGSVRIHRGYDEESKLWLDGWDGPMPGTTREEAEQAAYSLLHFVNAGQWLEDVDAFAWLAHVVTVAVRPMISGNTPAWVYTASSTGSGKSTLAKLAGKIGAWSPDSTNADPRDEAELLRRLEPFAGKGAVVLDNLHGVLRSGALEKTLTDGVLSARKLYVGAVEVPWRAVLSVTSNGAEIGQDWLRRSIPVRLVSGRIDPSRELLDEVQPWMTAAAITIVRAYLLSGERTRPSSLASFSAWSAVVPAAFAWLWSNLDLVAATREAVEYLTAADDGSSALLDELEAWRGEEGFLARELWEAATGLGQKNMIALTALCRELGNVVALTRRLGRLHDQTREVRAKLGHNKTKVWRVARRGGDGGHGRGYS